MSGILNGIDLAGLGGDVTEARSFPTPVPGRVVQIDADFLAYQVSAETAEEAGSKTLDEMKHNAEVAVALLKSMAGATGVHLHLTPSTSTKGGRYEQAIQKEYQGNRKDKPKPRYLHVIRDWLPKRFPGTLHMNCEADDGMASAQYAAMRDGNWDLSIIASKDKDLCMVPGWRLDWDTGYVDNMVEPFGYLQWKELPSGKKLIGRGTKFFWAQMLMGDTADNTQGLPKIVDLVNVVRDKPKPCGQVAAYNLLQACTNDRECLQVILPLYTGYSEQIGFKDYKDDSAVLGVRVFKSEAFLHWMRRYKDDPEDVLNWLKDIA